MKLAYVLFLTRHASFLSNMSLKFETVGGQYDPITTFLTSLEKLKLRSNDLLVVVVLFLFLKFSQNINNSINTDKIINNN